MSDSAPPPPLGTIVWHDLTVPHATEVRDFYRDVIGWTTGTESMGDYEDYYVVSPESGQVVGGVCHARGSNANLPPAWLMYVAVDDVEAACEKAIAKGGEVVDGPRAMGPGKFAVIRDPAGAFIGIITR